MDAHKNRSQEKLSNKKKILFDYLETCISKNQNLNKKSSSLYWYNRLPL